MRDTLKSTCDHWASRCIYINVDHSPFNIDVSNALIARVCRRELRSFEQLYRLFERPVYTLALRMLGDPDSARDVLHDAMLKVFDHIDQYRNDAPFWGWLRQIALNEVLMRLRKSRRFDSEAELPDCVDTAASPCIYADRSALERSLATLPTVTRSVLWLYHVEGYTHPEIAEFTGKTVSFSKSQVARGTAKLRALLAPAPEPMSCLIAVPITH